MKSLRAFPEGGGVGDPGVGALKGAFDALKAEAASQGFSRVIITGLRIGGANAPRYIQMVISIK